MDSYIIETAAAYLQEFYDLGYSGGTLLSMVCSAICEEDESLDEEEVWMIVQEMMDDAERR
ncbi:hypothetical protein [Thalassobaculum sp.]|uniref:hypothetical protein n=1 Tax=Thalassobaculum sp. TaxID=2022740 RepID=UPI003B5C923F